MSDPDDVPTSPATPVALSGIPGLQCLIRELAAGDECVDSFQPLDDAGCAFLVAQGKRAVGRYVENLSLLEISRILRSGLGLMPLSTCAGPGWVPFEEYGVNKGQAIIRRARALSLPQGLPIVLDYEGPAADTSVADATAFLNACSLQLVSDMRPAELYVGYDPILTGAQLAALPYVTRYYASSPYSPHLPVGYCLVQYEWNVHLGPLLVDKDRVQADAHVPARLPLALFAGASVPPPSAA